MTHFDCNEIFSFTVPQNIIDMVGELENAINTDSTMVDVYQDEIRSLAHGDTYDNKTDAIEQGGITEEEAEEIIDYFCRRHW